MNPTIQPSPHTRLSENPLGRTVSMTRRREWRHPWFTDPVWLPKKKAWAAFVLAGFVNGFAPVVRVTAGDLREARGTFYGQLADARTGAAESAQLALLAIGGDVDSGVPDDTVLDVPLYQRPPVPLSQWRAIGWGGDGRVPLFFQDRGVGKPSAVSIESEIAGVQVPVPPKGNRLLAACDIFLHQPRTALTSSITIEPTGFLSGVSNVTQTLAVREAAGNDRLKLQTGTYEPAQNPRLNFQGASNLLASDYEEKTWDEALVSTVYLMSPPDTVPGTPPDATWQPFAKHELFWNLSWAQPKLDPFFNTDIFRPLAAITGILAGGAGIGAVNFFAASINDATQGAFNILQAQSLAGSFWTPTGGGTTSATPAATAAAVPAGIDKAANAAAKARAAAKEKALRRLDPAFPFEGKKFNRSLL